MDEMNMKRRPKSLFFPILLVVVGAFLLLVNLGYVEGSVWNILGTYWPLIFIIGGLDGLYRRDGWVGPLVSLGLGTVFMLGNLGYLQWQGFDLLLRMWPILLIAWGLDVAFSHQRTVWGTMLRVGLGLLLVGGIIWLAVASPFSTGARMETYTQTLDGARHASIDFANGAGEFTLTGNADDTLLLTGTAGIPKNLTLTPYYVAPRDGTSTYSLQGSGVVVFPFTTTDSAWNFRINSTLPIDLTEKMGAGNMVLDLSDTKVETVEAEMGAGQVVLIFPELQDVSGTVRNAMGQTVLNFPKGSRVIIHYSGGLSSVDLPEGFSRSDNEITSNASGDYRIELNISQAMGNLEIREY